MIVADASAALHIAIGEHRPEDLRDEQLHALHLIDSEMANALRRLTFLGQLSPSQGRSALAAWSVTPVERYPATPLLGRIWELRDNLSAYDAGYVALAEALDCRLVTADARLAGAPGIRCPVTVVPR